VVGVHERDIFLDTAGPDLTFMSLLVSSDIAIRGDAAGYFPQTMN
jgi:hypothetical protein